MEELANGLPPLNIDISTNKLTNISFEKYQAKEYAEDRINSVLLDTESVSENTALFL